MNRFSSSIPVAVTGFGLGTLIYVFYITFTPSLKGVVIRRDSHNIIRFRLDSLWEMMRHPFHHILFWSPYRWDLNWPLVAGGISLAYFFGKTRLML